MHLITSTLFWIFLNIWGTIIPILYSPAFITKNSKLADHGAKIWAVVVVWMLKRLCKIEYEFVGLEKIPQEPCVIACKHQSMWETVIMHLALNRPAYVYKKELEKIPFYGWYLKVMTGIGVDRDGGASALKDLIKSTKENLAEGHCVVIFPQGTRVPVGAKTSEYPYQPGIAAMYNSCSVKVVPAALNSGMFWGKGRLVKTPGKIVLEFLDPIEPGLSKKEFMSQLESLIEKRSDELAGY